jgi:hypothetical protein
MKLKAIAAIFRHNKQLEIFNTPEGEQWVCNGVAMYSMRGMPHMSPEIVLRIFDVPPDKRSEWICRESEMPTVIDYSDGSASEEGIEPMVIRIGWYGIGYWLFPDGWRIYSFDEDYIKPLLDEPDYLTFHRRETENDGFVLACKTGFELKAIITPTDLRTKEKYTQEISNIASLYAAMKCEDIISAADEIFGTADKADPPPNTDPETGEILDGQTEFI